MLNYHVGLTITDSTTGFNIVKNGSGRITSHTDKLQDGRALDVTTTLQPLYVSIESSGLAYFKNLSATHTIVIAKVDEYGAFVCDLLTLGPVGSSTNFALCGLSSPDIGVYATGDCMLDYCILER